MSSKPKSGIECRHGVEAAIEAKHEFVEVCRQMMLADTVVSAHQPCFQIREGNVDQRQMCVRFRAVATEYHRFV